jgi:hypothetical protein
MRQALELEGKGSKPAGKQVQSATLVHVPSRHLQASEQIPVALHADGTTEVLRPPTNPAALKDIEDWSSRQQLPEPGKVTAAVVNLDPLPATEIPVAQADLGDPAPAPPAIEPSTP